MNSTPFISSYSQLLTEIRFDYSTNHLKVHNNNNNNNSNSIISRINIIFFKIIPRGFYSLKTHELMETIDYLRVFSLVSENVRTS